MRNSLAQDMYLSTVLGKVLEDFVKKHLDPAVKETHIVFGSYEDEARIYYALTTDKEYNDYIVWKHSDKAIDIIRKIYATGVLDDKKFIEQLLFLLQDSEKHRGIAEASLRFKRNEGNGKE